VASRKIGKVDYRVRMVKGHAYLYERTYVGSAGDSKPLRKELYMGRVDDVRAKVASQLELGFMAVALRRQQSAGQLQTARGAKEGNLRKK
jgi:hypothetical protein